MIVFMAKMATLWHRCCLLQLSAAHWHMCRDAMLPFVEKAGVMRDPKMNLFGNLK